MRVEAFEPTRLLAAYERVLAEHPHAVDQATLPDDSLLDRVRNRLYQTAERELPALAREFKPIELRAVLHLLATDQEQVIHERAALVLQARPRADLLSPAWTLLSNNYPREMLEGVVRYLGNELGWERARVDPERVERLSRWFAAPSLPRGLLDDFVREEPSALSAWLSEQGFDENHGLASAVWTTALTQADAALIERIGHAWLVVRADVARQTTQAAFGRNYLAALGGLDHWQVVVLEWILTKFGKPSTIEEGLTPFWRAVPPAQRRQFRQWTTAATIREFFESTDDPYGRYAFWETFQDRAHDARTALRGSAVLIDFGSFGVVEFAEVGNAAYLYPRAHFSEILGRCARAKSPGDLKQRSSTLASPHPGPNGDGRMLHSHAWQRRYAPWIRWLLDME